MDVRSQTGIKHIAGFTARLSDVALEVDDSCGPPDTNRIPMFCVESPEKHVDAARLLCDTTHDEPPYWLLVWIGARAVAHDLLTRSPLGPVTVLDLGCGLGLSGVAAGLAGARVTFCDSVGESLEFARASAEANGLSDFQTIRADFTRDALGRRFDMILAADIVYDPAAYDALAEFLDAHLDHGGTIVLTESLRADAGVFLAKMRSLGFKDGKQALWVSEEGRRERTWLHRLERG
jgi:predicted nicotinamide N-methyase